MRYLPLLIALFLSLKTACQNINLSTNSTGEKASLVVINTAGGDAVGEGGSVAYSIGQIFTSSSHNSGNSITEGVQQPILVIPEKTNPKEKPIKIVAFPNPMNNYLVIQVSESEKRDLFYQLYDTQGGLITSAKIKGTRTKLTPQYLEAAVYLLKITHNGQHLKSFKIIKN